MRLALISFHGCPVARLGEKDTGGMNVYVLNLANELGNLGHHVDVFTRYHDVQDPKIVELSLNVRVVHLDGGPISERKEDLGIHTTDFAANLHEFISEEAIEYDLVHSHYWLSGKIAAVISRTCNVPHVATFHTLAKTKLRARAGEKETSHRANIELEIMQSSHSLLVLTEKEKEDIRELYDIPARNIEVIPAGVDTNRFNVEDKITSRNHIGIADRETLLYVGRIEPIKGLDILFDALKTLSHSRDLQLVVVGGSLSGDKELKALMEKAETLGISDLIDFRGSVEQSDLKYYYSAADIFVLPSHYESFGLVALEAMACGTPVVASRVGGIPSFLDDGNVGYLIPWRCPEPFADKIEILLENHDLRKYMGKSAALKADQMNWSGIARQVVGLYGSAIEEYGLKEAV